MADFAFIPPLLRDLIQENHLTRDLKDPLVPHNLFREDITREKWDAQSGERRFITRNGTLAPAVRASRPRVDPAPQVPTIEQWGIEAKVLDGSTEVDIRQDFHTVVDEFRRRMSSLGLSAGTSVARWARAKLFQTYLGGQTWLTSQAVNTDTTIRVQSCAGFAATFDQYGRLSNVGAGNKLVVTIGGEAAEVIGCSPLDIDKPNGPGILTLNAAIAAGPHVAYVAVLAANRPKVIRAGGGTTSRAIGSGDVLTLALIEAGVAYLKALGVPTFPDGNYRVHLAPESIKQLRRDHEWQRQVRGVPDHERVTKFEVGRIASCVFIENEESPTLFNVDPAEDVAGAVLSADGSYTWGGVTYAVPGTGGQNIARPIIVGPESMIEHYVPEQDFETTPASANFGKREMIGEWVVDGGYLKTLVNGIYVYFRLPQDQKGERSTVTWSWTGDFGMPSDYRAQVQVAAAFKRGIAIEHVDLT